MDGARKCAAVGVGIALFAAGLGVGLGVGPLAAPVEAAPPAKIVCEAFFSPGGGAEAALIKTIDGAKREALCSIFLFTSRPVASAVKRAHARGVVVRVITDKSNQRIPNSQGEELAAAGIPVIEADLGKTDDNQPIKFHHKYVVVDQEVVATGSFNWTRQADTDNRENLVILYGKPVAEAFRANFLKEYEALGGK
jgi:phosphatidylserine/phosphatidylglycerophosphate/cardiolipin synthase-like enzyme